METSHSLEDLLEFLGHAGERGLMPVATAQALAVATRNVFSVLDAEERTSLPFEDIDAVVRRFNNKRARDFSPDSLKEYGRRVRRAVELYLQWKDDPANFKVKTRATVTSRKKEKPNGRPTTPPAPKAVDETESVAPLPTHPGSLGTSPGGFQTAFPVRSGHVVTIANIPVDLTAVEAERLAQFIRLLTLG